MTLLGLMARRSPEPDPWVVKMPDAAVVVIVRRGSLLHRYETGAPWYVPRLGWATMTHEMIAYRPDREGD